MAVVGGIDYEKQKQLTTPVDIVVATGRLLIFVGRMF